MSLNILLTILEKVPKFNFRVNKCYNLMTFVNDLNANFNLWALSKKGWIFTSLLEMSMKIQCLLSVDQVKINENGLPLCRII